MGSTLLINGKPLQVGQTGTIVFNVTNSWSSNIAQYYVMGTIGTPVIVPPGMIDYNAYLKALLDTSTLFNPPDPITSFFVTNIVGTITAMFYSGSYGGSYMYLVYNYISPSIIYQVPNYFSTATVSLGPSAYTNSYSTAVTISLNNVVSFYTWWSSPNAYPYTITINMKGSIIYTITGAL